MIQSIILLVFGLHSLIHSRRMRASGVVSMHLYEKMLYIFFPRDSSIYIFAKNKLEDPSLLDSKIRKAWVNGWIFMLLSVLSFIVYR